MDQTQRESGGHEAPSPRRGRGSVGVAAACGAGLVMVVCGVLILGGRPDGDDRPPVIVPLATAQTPAEAVGYGGGTPAP